MGKSKEALQLELWKLLQGQPEQQLDLGKLDSTVEGSAPCKEAWAALKSAGNGEGVNGDTALRDVLLDREDVFILSAKDDGTELIELTESAQLMSPEGGLPDNLLVNADFLEALAQLEEAEEADEAVPEPAAAPAQPLKNTPKAKFNGREPLPVGLQDAAAASAGAAASAPSVAKAAPAASKAPAAKAEDAGAATSAAPTDAAAGGAAAASAATTSEAGDGDEPPKKQARLSYLLTCRGKGKGKSGFFQDLIWTPALATHRDMEGKKDTDMLRALVKALEMHTNQGVTLSQLGSDFKVAQLKKDNLFKNVRLLDILKHYEDMFELVPDNTGGWFVKLQPGAQASLPHCEETMEQELKEEFSLPERIEKPKTAHEKMQALRIELIHALSRRGNKVPLQELGQEPRVQQRKQGLPQAKKLIEFIRLFPINFLVQSDDMTIEMASTNVSDQRMIDSFLGKPEKVEKPPPEPVKPVKASKEKAAGEKSEKKSGRGSKSSSSASTGSIYQAPSPFSYAYPSGYPAYPPGYAYPPPPGYPPVQYVYPPPPEGYPPTYPVAGYAYPPPGMYPPSLG